MTARTWFTYSAAVLGSVALLAYAALLVGQRMTDGPLNAMIPGGPLETGTLITQRTIDWKAELGDLGTCTDGVCADMAPVEFQLVDPAHSRYVGIMVHDGELYVPCDLGYMWGRFAGNQRRMLHLIYVFKRWHEDALLDGRAVVRIDGKRYERQAVRVTDPALTTALKSQLEDMARAWVAPAALAPPPIEGPNDIWFFRLDPRPV